jgi:DNA-binding SARP family transcriptional activator
LVSLRIYLTGTISVQHATMLVPQRAFPGPQGRVVFAMLAAEHGTPVSRDQLAEELWNGKPPISSTCPTAPGSTSTRPLPPSMPPRPLRALECVSEIWRRKGDHGQDARDAETILRLDPYRETAYLRLMLAHAAAGNRTSALLAYERCRARLTAELGTSPGAAIQELHLDLLRAR